MRGADLETGPDTEHFGGGMMTTPVSGRFDCESSITNAIEELRRRGVHRDDLERSLMAIAPVDLDLLAAILRRIDMAQAARVVQVRAA